METKKLLTEDLILEKLKERGIAEPNELDIADARKIILDYFDAEIVCDWPSHAQMYFYSQSTADGYEVYMATEDDRSPYIEQDLYYYESDWFEKLADAIKDGMCIHVDEYAQDEYSFEEVIQDVYETYWQDLKEEVENELIETGYEYEK